MRRIRKAAAMAVATMALAAGGAVGAAGTAHAVTYPEKLVCSSSTEEVRGLPGFGGPIRCGGQFGQPQYVMFDDGTFQAFAVGTDYALWTRWMNPNGTVSTWVTLGGVLSGGVFQKWDGRGNLLIGGRGSDGAYWARIRDVNGGWTPWNPFTFGPPWH
ncbi:hypothetical protein [Kitasatospora sp. NPDC056184]|uniref:hypothetical protein n=1 Tax=Kitasatospora sp. NPDC056184 TaxID=3345738 RepID=UPI0035DDD795